MHIQVFGQSEFALQVMVFGWQSDVPLGMHDGGGVPPLGSVLGAGGSDGVPVDGGTGVGGLLPEDPALPLPLPPAGAAVPPLQISVGVHVKPSPQSASTVQGGTHFGTHDFTVFVVQGSGVGVGHV